MATKKTWALVEDYFRPDSKIDNWGDPDLISDELLLKLYDFRKNLGLPIIVSQGVKESGHAAHSFHYPQNGACAVDVVIPGFQLSPFDLFIEATRYGFTGIGYYPHWRYKGKKVGGLHLDTRPLKWDKDETKNYRQSRWMGVMISGKQHYIPLTFQNMLDHFNNSDGLS